MPQDSREARLVSFSNRFLSYPPPLQRVEEESVSIRPSVCSVIFVFRTPFVLRAVCAHGLQTRSQSADPTEPKALVCSALLLVWDLLCVSAPCRSDEMQLGRFPPPLVKPLA